MNQPDLTSNLAFANFASMAVLIVPKAKENAVTNGENAQRYRPGSTLPSPG